MDPWRTLYPNSRQYSYFSPVHHSYSRIDFFLIDCELLPRIRQCDYEAIVLSDQSPLTLQLTFGDKQMPKSWRFNNNLLSNKKAMEEIKSQIDLYLSINDNTETSRSTLWEALKAYIRGHIISWSSLVSKQQKEKEAKIIEEIKNIDNQYSTCPSIVQ